MLGAGQFGPGRRPYPVLYLPLYQAFLGGCPFTHANMILKLLIRKMSPCLCHLASAIAQISCLWTPCAMSMSYTSIHYIIQSTDGDFHSGVLNLVMAQKGTAFCF
jgi:hypothetical protein